MVSSQEVVGYVVDHPDPEAEGDDVDDVCEDLEYTVDEPGVAGGKEAQQDGAGGEEEDEGEGGEDAVRDEDLLAGGGGLGGLGGWAEAISGLAWVVAVGASWAVGVSGIVASSVTTVPSTVLRCCGVYCGC